MDLKTPLYTLKKIDFIQYIVPDLVPPVSRKTVFRYFVLNPKHLKHLYLMFIFHTIGVSIQKIQLKATLKSNFGCYVPQFTLTNYDSALTVIFISW